LAGSIANNKLSNSTFTIRGTSRALGTTFSLNPNVDWQSVQTTGFTAVAGLGYFCNTTSAAFTVTLPASATRGDTIALVDYAGTFATNKLTINRNGHNIQGVANNSLIGTNRATLVLVYVDSTKGWLYAEEHNVADLGVPPQYVAATGGTVATSGNFKIHTFTGDGCFVVSNAGLVTPAGGSDKVDYLVIAGGGGGGGDYGSAGGGAGGYRTTFPSPGCNAGSFPISATTYPITVGGGGAGGPGSTSPTGQGASGSNSIFSTITSAGGGGGSSYSLNPGNSGGSGGGGGATGTASSPSPFAPLNNAGSGNTPPVSPPQGNPGGSGTAQPNYASSGGGGGAGAAGTSGGNAAGGPGGAGSTNSITSSPVTYSGGGGGGVLRACAPFGTAGSGGSGGGGAGSSGSGPSTAGTSNTGGGGGSGSRNVSASPGIFTGGAGGKGIVIIRYKFQ